MISWASALSCVTDTFEDAQHILIDFFGSLYDEEDEEYEDEEEYFDEEEYEEDEEIDYTEEENEDDDRK